MDAIKDKTLRRKLFVGCLAYFGAIIFAYLASTSFMLNAIQIFILTGFSILLIIKYVKKKQIIVMTFFLIIAIGFFSMSYKNAEFSKDILLKVVGQNAELTGKVKSFEKISNEKYCIYIRINAVNTVSCNTKIDTLLTCYGSIDKPWNLIGRNIGFSSKLEIPTVGRNPRCFNYNLFLRTKNIGTVSSVSNFNFINPNEKVRLISYIKGKILEKRIKYETQFADCNSDILGIVKGIIFGDTNSLSEDTYDDFRNNGTAHVLAVSGLHIGVIYGIYKKLFGKRKNLPALISFIMLLLFYGTVTLWSVSTIRAIIMILIAIIAQFINKRYDMLTTVTLVALIMAIINPYAFFGIGFQMTMLAILGITYFEKIISKYVGRGLSVMIAVQLVMTPYIAYIFNYVSISSFICGIPIIFIVSIFVPIALIGFLIFSVLGSSINILLFFTKVMANMIVTLNKFVSASGKFVIDIESVELWIVVLFYLMIFFIFSEYFQVFWKRRDYKKIIPIFALIIAFTLFVGVATDNKFNHAQAIFIDVGQGDAIHIRTEDGQNVLVDGGGSIKYNIGKKTLKPYFLKNNTKCLDMAIATHLHVDHYKGVTELSNCYKIKKLYVFDGNNVSSAYYLKKGDKIIFSKDEWIEILWPPKAENINIAQEDENMSSLIIKVILKDFSILITGDLGEEGEKLLLKEYNGTDKLKCDVLKIGHHGSKYSTSDDFLDAVSPQIAVIQVGKNNYGHPSKAVIEKLTNSGIIVCRNDLQGAVGISKKMNEYKIWTNIDY